MPSDQTIHSSKEKLWAHAWISDCHKFVILLQKYVTIVIHLRLFPVVAQSHQISKPKGGSTGHKQEVCVLPPALTPCTGLNPAPQNQVRGMVCMRMHCPSEVLCPWQLPFQPPCLPHTLAHTPEVVPLPWHCFSLVSHVSSSPCSPLAPRRQGSARASLGAVGS